MQLNKKRGGVYFETAQLLNVAQISSYILVSWCIFTTVADFLKVHILGHEGPGHILPFCSKALSE